MYFKHAQGLYQTPCRMSILIHRESGPSHYYRTECDKLERDMASGPRPLLNPSECPASAKPANDAHTYAAEHYGAGCWNIG